jgi:hypothetical protein
MTEMITQQEQNVLMMVIVTEGMDNLIMKDTNYAPLLRTMIITMDS